MKYLGIRDNEEGIELISILQIFGFSVFMPECNYYFFFSKYGKFTPIWVLLSKNQYAVFSITDADNWMEDLGNEIRKRYSPHTGFVYRRLKRKDVNSILGYIPDHINCAYSFAKENYDGSLSAYIIISNEPVTKYYDGLPEEWHILKSLKIIAYKGEFQELCDLFTVIENEYSNNPPETYLVFWYKYNTKEEKRDAIEKLGLIESEYGFLIYQIY